MRGWNQIEVFDMRSSTSGRSNATVPTCVFRFTNTQTHGSLTLCGAVPAHQRHAEPQSASECALFAGASLEHGVFAEDEDLSQDRNQPLIHDQYEPGHADDGRVHDTNAPDYFTRRRPLDILRLLEQSLGKRHALERVVIQVHLLDLLDHIDAVVTEHAGDVAHCGRHLRRPALRVRGLGGEQLGCPHGCLLQLLLVGHGLNTSAQPRKLGVPLVKLRHVLGLPLRLELLHVHLVRVYRGPAIGLGGSPGHRPAGMVADEGLYSGTDQRSVAGGEPSHGRG
mmetsp:Transcript_19971/g.52287  ORF Transcript_19971/g.52287 Transcript_19971/m.52287 type:complete len:281 (-) Transcript_19971:85-927(-)